MKMKTYIELFTRNGKAVTLRLAGPHTCPNCKATVVDVSINQMPFDCPVCSETIIDIRRIEE